LRIYSSNWLSSRSQPRLKLLKVGIIHVQNEASIWLPTVERIMLNPTIHLKTVLVCTYSSVKPPSEKVHIVCSHHRHYHSPSFIIIIQREFHHSRIGETSQEGLRRQMSTIFSCKQNGRLQEICKILFAESCIFCVLVLRLM